MPVCDNASNYPAAAVCPRRKKNGDKRKGVRKLPAGLAQKNKKRDAWYVCKRRAMLMTPPVGEHSSPLLFSRAAWYREVGAVERGGGGGIRKRLTEAAVSHRVDYFRSPQSTAKARATT